MPQIGDKISLATQLYDNAENKFPVAVVRDDAGVEISGSPFTLDLVEDGFYANYDEVFPDVDYLTAQYFVYSDSGHTVLDQGYGSVAETIYKSSTGGGGSGGPSSTYLVGVLDGQACEQENGYQDLIVRGEKHRLNVRFVRGDTGEPYDLTDAASVVARFLNEDETVTEITGVIVSAEAGKVYFILSEAQTEAMMPGTPAPFTVVVDLGSDGSALGNLPWQLAIVDPSVGAAE